jgi:hypothetical protein
MNFSTHILDTNELQLAIDRKIYLNYTGVSDIWTTNVINIYKMMNSKNYIQVINLIFERESAYSIILCQPYDAWRITKIYNFLVEYERYEKLLLLCSKHNIPLNYKIYLQMLKYRYITYKESLLNLFPKSIKNINLIGDFAISAIYFDLYIKCVEYGYIPIKQNIIDQCIAVVANLCRLSDLRNIIQHTINNFKCTYKLEDFYFSVHNSLASKTSFFTSVFQLCELGTNIEFAEFLKRCYTVGIIIDIKNARYCCSNNYEQIYFCYYSYIVAEHKRGAMTLKSDVSIKKTDSESIVKYLENNQVTFREMFKYHTPTQIKKYYNCKINGVKYDKYCVNNAYLYRNNAVIKHVIELGLKPTNHVCFLLSIKMQKPIGEINDIIYDIFKADKMEELTFILKN